MSRVKRIFTILIMVVAATFGTVTLTAGPAQADFCKMPDGTWRDC